MPVPDSSTAPVYIRNRICLAHKDLGALDAENSHLRDGKPALGVCCCYTLEVWRMSFDQSACTITKWITHTRPATISSICIQPYQALDSIHQVPELRKRNIELEASEYL